MKPSALSLALVAALVFAGLRVEGFRSPAFQAFAHLYVGGLIAGGGAGACLAGKGRRRPWVAAVLTGVALSLVELACFLFLPKGVSP